MHAKPDDVVIVPSSVGMPGRALRNAFAEQAIADSPKLNKRCFASCLHACKCRDQQSNYCIIQVLDKAARGDIDQGLVFAGSNAGRAERIMPVAELMVELVTIQQPFPSLDHSPMRPCGGCGGRASSPAGGLGGTPEAVGSPSP